MFIIAALILIILNANAVVIPSWVLITAIVLGSIELGFYVLAAIINFFIARGIFKEFKK